MNWSEFKSIPNEYSETVKAIDKRIIGLISERTDITKGKRFFPPKEIVGEWAVEFGLSIPQINGLLHNLAEVSSPTLPIGPGKLLNVLPIMKRAIVNGFEYEITHSMQHEGGSIVYLEIYQSNKSEVTGRIRPQLLLDISGEKEYRVSKNSAGGGGGHAQISFIVTPRLPQSIEELKLRLIPYAPPMERSRNKEFILDKEISFED
ncbi:hypothetical protein BK126_06580 [Paenibacillus sp. FSL H7-0326]|uniref:hypothetical protein n=1 Tax=Paenibacillus sp. FSL H7-0326 TaxID=1921144 RepID=UPI00096FAD01|nr:hypothetical protein [Paenibacillus sp. FSL H7-0326]OMC71720.1 hypothetical protein BK126_06580 [Paenibacillus sp. FSL H7-0326]